MLMKKKYQEPVTGVYLGRVSRDPYACYTQAHGQPNKFSTFHTAASALIFVVTFAAPCWRSAAANG